MLLIAQWRTRTPHGYNLTIGGDGFPGAREVPVFFGEVPVLSPIPTPGQILEEAKAKGWSIKKLCDEAGISDETFFRWRDGRNSIGIDKLQALINAVNQEDMP